MPRFIAIVKFLICFFLTTGLLISFFLTPDLSSTSITVESFLIAISATYIYYLIKTGLWNLYSNPYVLKVPIIIGLLIHFVSVGYFIYFSIDNFSLQKQGLHTLIPFWLFALFIGVYDIIQLYKSRKKINTNRDASPEAVHNNLSQVALKPVVIHTKVELPQ